MGHMESRKNHEFQIVRASLEHLDQVAPLFHAYRDFYAQKDDLSRSRAFLEERMLNNESVIFLAIDQSLNTPAGFTQLYPIFSSPKAKRKWLLNDLFVAPSYRRAGVGRMLMQHAINFAKETKSRGLELSTAVDNVTAQSLYESVGFTRDQKFHHYYLIVDE